MERPNQDLRLRDYARICRKRHRLIVGVLVLVVAVVLVYSFVTPNTYQASAIVEVQGQSGFVIRAQTPVDDSSGSLTPTTLTALVGSQPYQELAESVAALAAAYRLDLTARRSQDDIVELFENDLITKPLPAFFGKLAMKSTSHTARQLQGLLVSPASGADEPGTDATQLPRRLSSAEKDEAIKEAGALRFLAARFGIDATALATDREIRDAIVRVMGSPLVTALASNPLRGTRWTDLPPLEQGAAIEAAFRDVRLHHPNASDRTLNQNQYSTREIKETGMLTIDYSAASPQGASDGANAMVDVVVWKNQYLRKSEAQRFRQVTEQALYGTNDRGGVASLLHESDRNVRNYKKAHGIPDLALVRDSLAKQATELTTNYAAAAAAAAGAQRKIRALSSSLAAVSASVESPTVMDNPAMSKLEDDYANARSDLDAALARYTPDNPIAMALNAKVTSLRNEIGAQRLQTPSSREVRQEPNLVYQQLVGDLRKAQSDAFAAQAQQRALGQQLQRAQAQIAHLPDEEYQMSSVVRDQYGLQSSMRTLQEKYLDAQLNEATKMSNARVVQLALEPGKKIRPRRTLNVLFGSLLGLFLGLAGAVVAETLDPRLSTTDDLERALPGVPILACIPEFRSDGRLVVGRPNGHPIAESFTALRSAIRFLEIEQPFGVLLVSSAAFGDGKSTVAANLAAAMAQSGRRVLLIDADLRRPSQHTIFSAGGGQGLSAVLLGDADLRSTIDSSPIERLSLLFSGATPPNPSELLASDAMRALIARARSERDLVVIDSQPVGAGMDAAVLASLADGVLLVVGAGGSSAETVSAARRSLERARARLIGLVLNRAESSPKDGLYQAVPGPDESLASNGHRKSRRAAGAKDRV